jgi:predicted phage gp36 major capsid-like protein
MLVLFFRRYKIRRNPFKVRTLGYAESVIKKQAEDRKRAEKAEAEARERAEEAEKAEAKERTNIEKRVLLSHPVMQNITDTPQRLKAAKVASRENVWTRVSRYLRNIDHQKRSENSGAEVGRLITEQPAEAKQSTEAGRVVIGVWEGDWTAVMEENEYLMDTHEGSSDDIKF